jgi:hypothetical protein
MLPFPYHHSSSLFPLLQAVQRSSDSALCYDDLAAAVQDSEVFEFLDEVVPQRVLAQDAATMNLHLKLTQGVTVNPQKKVRCLQSFQLFLMLLPLIVHASLQARTDIC